jgi:hypothetical protein
MKSWLTVLGLMACVSLVVFGRPNVRPSAARMGEDDFRKLEQAWLDAASVPNLPALRQILSDDFMGTSFGGGVLSKDDVIPAPGVAANHMPKCTLKDSTVRIFGDTAVLMGQGIATEEVFVDAALEIWVPSSGKRLPPRKQPNLRPGEPSLPFCHTLGFLPLIG